jgi:hypothetical protein
MSAPTAASSYCIGSAEQAEIEGLLSRVRSVDDNLADEFETLLTRYP